MSRGGEFLLGGALLALEGCYPNLTFDVDVTYEVQVRDDEGRPVPDVRIMAFQNEGLLGRRSAEGRTDPEGLCVVETGRSPCAPNTSASSVAAWLSLTMEKEGFESIRMEFTPEQFIRKHGGFRRSEALVLKRKQP